METFSNSQTVLFVILKLFLVSQLIVAFETINCWFKGWFSNSGFFPWKIIKLDSTYFIKNSFLKNLLESILSGKGFLWLIFLKTLIIVFLMFQNSFTPTLTALLLILMLLNLVLQFRQIYGGEGSDQMNLLLIVSLFIGMNHWTNPQISSYSIFFIAAQSVLSYFSAGAAKIVSPKWRSGSAVFEIFNTGSYGNHSIALVLHNKKGINLFLAWNVIIMEMLFPLVLVLPFEYGALILIWGGVFHLFNAFSMGLNTFLWSFLATYPAIIYTNYYILN